MELLSEAPCEGETLVRSVAGRDEVHFQTIAPVTINNVCFTLSEHCSLFAMLLNVFIIMCRKYLMQVH